ncbi:hypothetical protein H0H87_000983 [Tephrocybe sp. NHM501043]|nr:hypothetical protein H0H87_000983 [Tephrocybe sp. NHM501043]
MAKGVLVDLPFDAGRSDHPGTSRPSAPSVASSSRTSVLASVVPMLRRHADDIQKAPLLTLKLSATSFLDTSITDDVTDQPLYIIKTFGPTTTIKRADPWDGDTKTAEIRWSKTVPTKGKNSTDGVSIQMRGIKWKGSETLLRRGTLTGYVGHAPVSMFILKPSFQWEEIQDPELRAKFEMEAAKQRILGCTTAAVKGPIAILHPATDSHSSHFQIFETLHDKNDARPMLVHHGVSTLLLDYLLITALFLVTDAQEWTHVQGADITIPIGHVPELPGLSPPQSAPSNFSTSNQQWRKIISSSEEVHTPTPISAEQMAKVQYGHPIFPGRRSSSPAPSTSDSGAPSEHMFFSPTATRPHSPASESIFSPVSRSAAPAHTYLDPSFYNEDVDVPPVPSIPAHLIHTSEASHSPRSRPSSSQSSTTSSNIRRLPEIPILPPVHPLVPRPRSTPPRPRTGQSSIPESTASGPSVPHASVSDSSAIPRRPTRQLPRPPQTPSQPVHTEARQFPSGMGRARSQSQSHASREKWRPHAAYGQRTLPSPPTSSSREGAHPPPLQLQRVLSEDGRFVVKDADDDWVGTAEPGVGYDMPPPAYNSINFSPADSPLQSPASPMRREL